MTVAMAHGLFDLRRIEELVLRHVGETFFRLPGRAGTADALDDPYDPDSDPEPSEDCNG